MSSSCPWNAYCFTKMYNSGIINMIMDGRKTINSTMKPYEHEHMRWTIQKQRYITLMPTVQWDKSSNVWWTTISYECRGQKPTTRWEVTEQGNPWESKPYHDTDACASEWNLRWRRLEPANRDRSKAKVGSDATSRLTLWQWRNQSAHPFTSDVLGAHLNLPH